MSSDIAIAISQRGEFHSLNSNHVNLWLSGLGSRKSISGKDVLMNFQRGRNNKNRIHLHDKKLLFKRNRELPFKHCFAQKKFLQPMSETDHLR